MNPQDDPEQRIRDLEQPLADRAYTSELPTGETYSYAAQLPPPVYPDAPYPPAPPSSGSGNRGWLIIVGVVAFAVICTAAVGTGVYLASRGSLTAGTPTTGQNTYSGGGSLSTTSPDSTETTASSEPTETQTTAPQATTATDAPPPPGGPLSVSGVGSDRDIVCNNSVVSISGVSNTVTISGHCASVTVSGIENQVTLDSADTISASGFDNRITYHEGAPQVENAGGSNVISQG